MTFDISDLAQWPAGKTGIALLFLRLFMGAAFIQHGRFKARVLSKFAQKFGVSPFMAGVATYTQLVGGVLLMAGFATPIASIAIAATMAVAIWKLIGRGEQFVNPEVHSWESAGFYLVAAIIITLLGPGAFSLDNLLFG